MSYQLPESFYDEGHRKSLNLSRLRTWSILMILFAGWNLFTSTGLIRRNILSPEFPNSEFGIQRAYVNEDRELVLERKGYVDRIGKYSYDMEWNLSKSIEHDIYTGVRLDSTPSISSQYRTSGVPIDIKPGELTLEKIRRSSHRLRGKQSTDEWTQTKVLVNEEGKGDIRSLKELPDGKVPIEDLQVIFMSNNRLSFNLLPGHQYLPFRDAHCYVDPLLGEKYSENVLYITTDKQSYIHRIRLDPDQYRDNWIERDRTAHLALPLERGFDSHLCHHPDDAKLMLLNSDGRITFIDNKSLVILESKFLPGNWEREYASLFQSTGFYSDEFGVPLTRVQALRIYRILAAMLLLGILLLIAGFLTAKREDIELENGTGELHESSTVPQDYQ